MEAEHTAQPVAVQPVGAGGVAAGCDQQQVGVLPKEATGSSSATDQAQTPPVAEPKTAEPTAAEPTTAEPTAAEPTAQPMAAQPVGAGGAADGSPRAMSPAHDGEAEDPQAVSVPKKRKAPLTFPAPGPAPSYTNYTEMYKSIPVTNSRMAPPVDRAVLESMMHLPRDTAAQMLGLCSTTFKKVCRRSGLEGWPYKRPLLGAEDGGAASVPVASPGAPYTLLATPTRAPAGGVAGGVQPTSLAKGATAQPKGAQPKSARGASAGGSSGGGQKRTSASMLSKPATLSWPKTGYLCDQPAGAEGGG
ncbi:hypothetical protein T484DRAFT_1875632, partial [Baffinella frigidus]